MITVVRHIGGLVKGTLVAVSERGRVGIDPVSIQVVMMQSGGAIPRHPPGGLRSGLGRVILVMHHLAEADGVVAIVF